MDPLPGNRPVSPWRRRFGVYVPPLVVLAFVGVMLASMEYRARSTLNVERSYQRIQLLHEIRTRLVDAETGQRGYLITGDDRYLAPFHDAQQDVEQAVTVLARSYANNPGQLARLTQLDSLLDLRFAIMGLPVRAFQEAGSAAAREQLIAGGGREAMEVLRAEIAELEAQAVDGLAGEQAAQTRAGILVLIILLLGAGVIVLTALVTNRQFRSYTAELEARHAEEQELNARLQEQALELEVQASELQATNDELIEQQAHVEAMAAELEASNEELQVTNVRLEERTQAAEAANHAKAQFLASMSHELRTPLNAIGGYVDLLELGVHGPMTEAQRADLERIRHNSRHLLLLISDILNFAKIQAGRLDMDVAGLSLRALLDELETVVRPLVDARQITFITEEPPAAEAWGDGDRVRQILLNLLSNAVKFTGPGGTVFLKTRVEPDRVHIDVADSGIGIAPELHESIFDPFVQIERGAGGALRDGIGLGLSISRELARGMGGDITVQSAPGQGSVFTLTLPRDGQRTPAARPDEPSLAG